MMKLELEDRFGYRSFAWIRNPKRPELTDERGRPLMDMTTHPFFPQPYRGPKKGDPVVKTHVDPFFMRPYCRPLSTEWVERDPESEVFTRHFAILDEAIQIITGKRIIGVTK